MEGWDESVSVSVGLVRHKTEDMTGNVFMADFGCNEIEIKITGMKNIIWRGTSQEFKKDWE